MIDPKKLRTQLAAVQENLSRRNFILDVDAIEALEKKRQVLQSETQSLQAARNQQSKEIGIAKATGADVAAVMETVANTNQLLKVKEEELTVLQAELKAIQYTIPNLLDASVPEGKTEDDNQEIRCWGEPTSFDFQPKEHQELGDALTLLDAARAAKLSGARFVVLHKKLARLQRALTQFMLDLHTEQHDYEEVYVPALVHSEALYGTGQLPKFKDDLFTIAGDQDFSLISTGEIPITNLHRGEIIEAEAMPKQYVAHTPCFRSEAGSYGRDTKGMIRLHQFEKVEMVQLVRPDDSYNALERMTAHAEKILQLLKLPYRVVALCTGDIGFTAAKTYDLEVWLPGQNKYREISSVSNCEDFQARRMGIRWRNPTTGKPELLHTLNGSGLAVGRTLVAVMENYQDEQGNIVVPDVLRPYMGGVTLID